MNKDITQTENYIHPNVRGRQILAIAYVPIQNADFDKVYDDDRGFVVGTVFPELNLPFTGERGTRQ